MAVEYTRGMPGELPEIRDFINMVFSMHSRPHDFGTLLPKLYRENAGSEPQHYLAREDGRIVAAVCAHPFTICCQGITLPCTAIGSVSVHPYARGQGFMRSLMDTAVNDMEQSGIALSVLDGRRHRYAYYGYEPAGHRLEYQITDDNLRHMDASCHRTVLSALPLSPSLEDFSAHIHEFCALQSQRTIYTRRTPAEFAYIASSWGSTLYRLAADGKTVGYACAVDGTVRELVLHNESFLYDSLVALLEAMQGTTLTISVAPWDTARITYITPLYDHFCIHSDDKYHIFDFPRVLAFFLAAKAANVSMPNGRFTFAVDQASPTCVSLENREVCITPASETSVRLTRAQATAAFFSPDALFSSPMPTAPTWFPLPLSIPTPHTC